MQRFWWLNFVRGIVALIIGILVIGWPQSAYSLFANFFAVYWVSSGLISLQWGLSTHQKEGLWSVEGTFEVVVGLAILLRYVYRHYLGSEVAVRIFGLVALLVGLIRIVDKTRGETRAQSFGNILLGLFEIGLGALLIFLDALEPFTKLLAGGWAFVGGVLLILQSLQGRRARSVRSSP